MLDSKAGYIAVCLANCPAYHWLVNWLVVGLASWLRCLMFD